jgi:hypothetical protein
VLTSTGAVAGWQWGTIDGAKSWGRNVISGTRNSGSYGQQLEFKFDADGIASEGMVTTGDSGAGVFIRVSKIWALVGVESTADCHYSAFPSGTSDFYATLTDSRGFYLDDGAGNWNLVTGDQPVPSMSQPTRVSNRVSWLSGYVPDLRVVPEPATAGLLALGAVTLLLRPRRKRKTA